MKGEKREERKEEIVVLDEGIDVQDMADPKSICCGVAFSPFRW